MMKEKIRTMYNHLSKWSNNKIVQNVINSLLVIAANVWVAIFSLLNPSEDVSVAPMPLAILFGFILIIIISILSDGFSSDSYLERTINNGISELIKQGFKSQGDLYFCLLASFFFFVLLFLPVLLGQRSVLPCYLSAILLLNVACLKYNNPFFISILKALWTNYVCPIAAFAICVKFVLKYPQIINKYVTEDAFKGFMVSLCNLLINTIYVATFTLFLPVLVVTIIHGLEFIISFINIRKQKKKNVA
ncbi:hypothetical protein [Butyrivibrio sp. LC3010]|uniref:hypothetical protein n=1 Tax=Butyrivibrio sp. LC3010 TaxID=1280680 RepID=UPI0003F64F10|nr:hypothetical protein [Butyrivibrio sp. LC3010]